jgi:predicted P-loop ATPase
MTPDLEPPPPDSEFPPTVVPIGRGVASSIHSKSISGVVTILRDQVRRSYVLGTADELRFNEMSAGYELGARVLELDHFIAEFQLRCEDRVSIGHGDRAGPVKFPIEAIAGGMMVVAKENSYHPVREYLNGLEPVPGAIERYASDVLHLSEQDELSRTLFRMWAVAAVRRVMVPGIVFDNVLVFEGPKGYAKSGFFRALASDAWYSGSAMDIDNTKALEALHTAWIFEWQELMPVRRKPLETVQAFLSTPVDTYVRPYGRGSVRRPRTGVVVGTSNNAQFLPQFERRFHPVRIVVPIDWRAAIRDRDEFWGEATALHLAGEACSFDSTGTLGVQLTNSQDGFVAEHPWSQDVTKWLATNPTEITTRNALSAAGFGPQKPPTRADEMGMSELLNGLRLCRDSHPSTLHDGSRARLWRTTSTTNQ